MSKEESKPDYKNFVKPMAEWINIIQADYRANGAHEQSVAMIVAEDTFCHVFDKFVSPLQKELSELREEISENEKEILRQGDEIESLNKENEELKEKLNASQSKQL